MNINNLITRIETQRFSFLVGFLSLYAIIITRNLLESAFEGTQVLGFSPMEAHSFYMVFVHFALFYVSLFLWFLFVLVLLTREDWTRVSKALIIGMAAILVVPLIDIIISRGSGYKLTYVSGFGQVSQLHRFFDFASDILEASWGQRVEVMLVLGSGLVYVYFKTRNLIKSLITLIMMYLIIFIHGVMPNTIAKIPQYLGSTMFSFRALITDGVLAIDSQNYAVVFALSSVLAGFLLLRMSRPNVLNKIFKFKPAVFHVLFLFLGIVYALILILPYYPFIFNNPFFYLIFILATLIWQFIINSKDMMSNSFEFKAISITSILFAIVLGPIFLLLATMSLLTMKFLKQKWLVIIPGFVAGFCLIFQETTFQAIRPLNMTAIQAKGRKIMGWTFFLNAEYEKALDQYLKAYSLSDDPETIKRLGQTILNLGQIDRGIKLLADIGKPDYETILTLGQIYSQQGAFEKAILVYNIAIERNLEPAEFHLKTAQTQMRLGAEAEMNKALGKSVLYGTPKYRAYEIQGDFYLSTNNPLKAEQMYGRALFYNPRSIAGLTGIGIILFRKGDYEQAEREFLRALKIEPGNDAIFNNLGNIYLVTRRYTIAEQYFLKSIKKNPNQVEAYYNLGLIYENTGDNAQAYEMYLQALRVNPSYAPAQRKIKELD